MAAAKVQAAAENKDEPKESQSAGNVENRSAVGKKNEQQSITKKRRSAMKRSAAGNFSFY